MVITMGTEQRRFESFKPGGHTSSILRGLPALLCKESTISLLSVEISGSVCARVGFGADHAREVLLFLRPRFFAGGQSEAVTCFTVSKGDSEATERAAGPQQVSSESKKRGKKVADRPLLKHARQVAPDKDDGGSGTCAVRNVGRHIE